MASNYSPIRSPGSLRLHHHLGGGGEVSRLRSSSHKKPPEPLRRAMADCLSSSAAASPNHGTPSLVISEASRTLRFASQVSISNEESPASRSPGQSPRLSQE